MSETVRILLINIDSKIPNLALEKLRVYHKVQNDEVSLIKDTSSFLPLFVHNYDKIYVSCVFDYNKHLCKKWEGIAEIGGSGYNLKKRLPPEVEQIKPKMNFGFTTRGCIRNCYFCIVPKKEGKIRIVGDVYDLWDGKAKDVLIMDNNILAAPEHFFKISEQLKKEKLTVDFNQGLDHRLLTNRICRELLSLSHKGFIRFAFDHISYKESVLKALKMLKKNGMKTRQTRWYIYVGVKDTSDNVLERINILRDEGQFVFLMRDRNKQVQANLEFTKIYQWSYNFAFYFAVPYPPKQLPKKDNSNNKINLFKLRKKRSIKNES